MSKYNLFPLTDPISYEFFKKQQVSLWLSEELDFKGDLDSFNKLTEEEKVILELILGFFSPGDGMVSFNIVHNMMKSLDSFENYAFLGTQLYIEIVHAETYGKFIQAFYPDENDQKRIMEMAINSPIVKLKTDWIEQKMKEDIPLAERYLTFACVEGIFFCFLFALVFYFRKLGKLRNFIVSNEFISRDETLHRDYGCYMFKKLNGDREAGKRIISSAVDIETKFIWEMACDIDLPLTYQDLCQYLFCIADQIFHLAGYDPMFNSKNPFVWINEISLSTKNNFYELPVGSYRKEDLKRAIDWKSQLEDVKEEINYEEIDF